MDYINSLKGRTCWVYQGGNDTSFGRIVDTTEDYMVMHTEDDEIIYFTIDQVKTICEDSTLRFVSLSCFENNPEYVRATNLQELLDKLKYRSVKINSGQEVRTGMLAEVKDDYISMFTEEDGVIFYTSHYIHSISEPNRSTNEISYQEAEFQSFQPINDEIIAANFNKLLTNLKYSWVMINRNRHDRIDGLLVEVHEEYLTLIQKQMIIRVPIVQIRNISYPGVSVLNKEEADTIHDLLVIEEENNGSENLSSLSVNEVDPTNDDCPTEAVINIAEVATEESTKKKQMQ